MNAQQLFLADGKSAGAWYCGECNIMHSLQHAPIGRGDVTYTREQRLEKARETAERCCNYRCEQCGEKAKQFHDLCDKCRDASWRAEAIRKEQESFAKATERTDYDGPFMFDDHCFDSVEDVLEHCECREIDVPEYLWIPERIKFEMDADRIIENALEEHHEDADDRISKEDRVALQAFLDEWCAKTTIESFSEIRKEYVRVQVPAAEGSKP